MNCSNGADATSSSEPTREEIRRVFCKASWVLAQDVDVGAIVSSSTTQQHSWPSKRGERWFCANLTEFGDTLGIYLSRDEIYVALEQLGLDYFDGFVYFDPEADYEGCIYLKESALKLIQAIKE